MDQSKKTTPGVPFLPLIFKILTKKTCILKKYTLKERIIQKNQQKKDKKTKKTKSKKGHTGCIYVLQKILMIFSFLNCLSLEL